LLDLDALTKRVSESVGPAAPVAGAPTDPDAPAEGVEGGFSLAEVGDRALAAFKHGDGESFAQAVLDIMSRGR
jgi:hypothetical protein